MVVDRPHNVVLFLEAPRQVVPDEAPGPEDEDSQGFSIKRRSRGVSQRIRAIRSEAGGPSGV